MDDIVDPIDNLPTIRDIGMAIALLGFGPRSCPSAEQVASRSKPSSQSLTAFEPAIIT